MSEQTGDKPAPSPTAALPPHGRPGLPGTQGQWPIRPGDPIPPGWMMVPGRPGYIQPRLFTPPPPGVLSTHWKGPARPAASIALSAIGFAGLVAAIALVGRPGVGWLSVGLALAVVGVLAARAARRAPATEVGAASWPALTAAAQLAAPPIVVAAPASVAAPAAVTAPAAEPAAVADTGSAAAEPIDASEADPTVATAIDAPAAEPSATAATDADPTAAASEPDPAAAEPTGPTAAGPTAAAPTDTAPSGTEPATTTPAPSVTDIPADTTPVGGIVGWLKKYGERTFWAAVSLALLSVSVFRDAGWLIFWSIVGFLLCGAIALSGGRTVKGFVMSAVAAIAAPFAGIPWLTRGIQQAGKRRGGLRIFLAVVITIVLVIIFGALFAGADPEFNELVTNILPTLSAAEIARAIVCFVLITMVAIGVGYLASARPTFDAITGTSTRKVRRIEWVLPLAVLNLLFVLFDVIQLTVLFNDDGALATKSKAYMKDYAHTGFWQLVWVTVLTLVVLALAFRLAPRAEKVDRVFFRVLLGGLSVLSMVIVASALKRVSSYERLYGYTRLRVVVGGIELWVAFVFVLLFLAAMLIKANWLPRVIGGSLAVALFAGALVNPDLYVADHNVDRYLHTGKLSVTYMAVLSADAAPAVIRLNGQNKACSAITLWTDELNGGEDWRSWNYSRAWARHAYIDAGLTSTDFSNCRMLNRYVD